MYKYLATLLLGTISFFNGFAQTTAKEWYDLGMTLKSDEGYKDAIAAFKRAVFLKDDYADAMHQLGWCYNEQGLYSDAVDILVKEYNAGPTDKAANSFELGYAYEQTGQYDQAATYLNKAIDFDNNFALAYKERGYVNYKLNKYDKAIDDFNKYESSTITEIEDADYYYTRGWIENAQEKYGDAEKSLKKSVSLDDKYANAFSELGYTDYKLKLNDEAIKNYRVAMELDPKDYHPVLGTADVYFENLTNYDSAIVYYDKGTQMQPKNKTAFYRLGWCYNDRKKYNEAIDALRQAILLQPDYPLAKQELGYAYYKLNKCDEALAQFEPMINSDPNNALSRYYAGFCYYLKKDQDSLKKMIEELKALNSTRYVETLMKYVK